MILDQALDTSGLIATDKNSSNKVIGNLSVKAVKSKE